MNRHELEGGERDVIQRQSMTLRNIRPKWRSFSNTKSRPIRGNGRVSTLGRRKGRWRLSFLPPGGGVLEQGVFVGKGGRMEDWRMEDGR